MIALLRRNAALRRLVLGFAGAQLGLQIGWIALVWFVLNEAHSPQLLGALFVAFQIPTLLVAPLIGPLLDRADARRIALFSIFAGTAAICALAALASMHALTLPLLFALVVIVSLSTPATLTYRRLLIGQVAAQDDLTPAYGLFSLATEASILLGPAAGGAIIGSWSVAPALYVFAFGNAAYLAAIATTHYVREDRRSERKFDVLQGTREIVKRPLVLGITLLTFFFFLAYGPLEVALPVAARTIFHTNATGYGGMWSAYAAGSVAGLLVLRARYQRLPTVVVLCAIAVMWGILASALAFTASLASAMAVLLVAGFLWSPYNAIESSFMQLQVPADVQGAVFSMQSSFLYMLAVPLGAMLGGLSLTHTTPRIVMLGSGLGCVLAGVIGFAALQRRTAVQPQQ
jgi:predicted MFS family arabinose efflux permease